VTGVQTCALPICRNGEFYCLGSLFEDERDSNKIFFDTRMARVAEVFLYCKRLYSGLGFNSEHVISIHIRHSGLRGRVLTSANRGRLLRSSASSVEDQSEVAINVRLDRVESELPQLVKKVLEPLFALFDFFEFDDAVYEDIVTKFARGEI